MKLEPEATGTQVLELVCNQDSGRRQSAPCNAHQPAVDGVQPYGVQRWPLVRHGCGCATTCARLQITWKLQRTALSLHEQVLHDTGCRQPHTHSLKSPSASTIAHITFEKGLVRVICRLKLLTSRHQEALSDEVTHFTDACIPALLPPLIGAICLLDIIEHTFCGQQLPALIDAMTCDLLAAPSGKHHHIVWDDLGRPQRKAKFSILPSGRELL